MSRLSRRYEEQTRKTKILELISEGKTPYEISSQLKVTRRYVDETLKETLASTETPEKILAMRDLQSAQIQTHTPRLAQRFIKQADIQNKLTDHYIRLIDEKDNISYTTIFDQHVREGLTPEQAHQQTTEKLEEYARERETLSKEIERISKQTDQSYRTYLEQQKRLSQLHGTDTPTQHQLLISRTDQIKIELENDILKTQKEIEQPTIEAEIVEEN